MDTTRDETGASRRTLLKSGAIGVGALATALGAVGVTSTNAEAVIPAPPASSAGSFLLKLAGITGDSTDDRHKGEIPILSFDFGITHPAAVASTGAGQGKVAALPFTFTARTGIASPALFLAVAAGKHIPTATLTVLRKGESPSALITISLNDVILTGYELANDPSGGAPLDQFTLVYARLAYSASAQKADGSVGSVTKSSWNFVANRQ